MASKAAVLYIDDEYLNLSAFEIRFKNQFSVFITPNPGSAIEFVKNNKFDVIIADQKMPVVTGVELLKKIIEIDESTLRIIHSGYMDDPEINKAIDEGIAHALLDKPLDKSKMMDIIEAFMGSRNH